MKRRQKIKNGNGWPLSRVVRWADRAARVARVAKGWQHFSLKTALILNYQVGTRFSNPLPPRNLDKTNGGCGCGAQENGSTLQRK